MRFILETDYAVQIRTEIAKIIDTTVGSTKLATAEDMAISQIKNFIASRYDVAKIFAPKTGTDETRDLFIVMIVIDIALYHLWTKEAANAMPKLRAERYGDALEWLKLVQSGSSCNLPPLEDDNGDAVTDVRIWSDYKPENNMY